MSQSAHRSRGKSKASTSTAHRRKQDAELQRMYDRVHASEDAVSRVERVVAQLTLSTDAPGSSAPVEPISLPPHTSPSPPTVDSTSSTRPLDQRNIFNALREELATLERAERIMRDAQISIPLVGQELKFLQDPRTYGEYRRRELSGDFTANSGPFALRPDEHGNSVVLRAENNLVHVLGALTASSVVSHPSINPLRESLLSRVLRDLESLDVMKNNEWNRQRQGIPSAHETHRFSVKTGIYALLPSRWPLADNRSRSPGSGSLASVVPARYCPAHHLPCRPRYAPARRPSQTRLGAPSCRVPRRDHCHATVRSRE